MIAYALNSNAVIAVLAARTGRVATRLFSQAPGAVALPTIVMHELYWGAFKSQRAAHHIDSLRLLIADMPVLDFDANDAFVAGQVRATLAALGKPIGRYDLLIAGQAKARGLTVVTNNVREFGRVAGLSVEDWTQ